MCKSTGRQCQRHIPGDQCRLYNREVGAAIALARLWARSSRRFCSLRSTRRAGQVLALAVGVALFSPAVLGADGSASACQGCFVAPEPSPGGPPAPTGLELRLVPADDAWAVDLSWTDDAPNETCYVVERALGGVEVLYPAFATLAVLDVNTTSYRDPGPHYPPAAAVALYRVYAATATSRSHYSNEQSTSFPSIDPTPPPPGTPYVWPPPPPITPTPIPEGMPTSIAPDAVTTGDTTTLGAGPAVVGPEETSPVQPTPADPGEGSRGASGQPSGAPRLGSGGGSSGGAFPWWALGLAGIPAAALAGGLVLRRRST